MHFLMIHEFHYLRGGAERYLFDLMGLLEARGHTVASFSTRSPENRASSYEDYFISEMSFRDLLRRGGVRAGLRAGGRALYSLEARRSLARLLCDTKPDLVHVFGFAHYLSASIFDAIAAARVPVVQSLLDYKWLCPNTTFLSHGALCEHCRGGRYYEVVRRRCKRGSLAASVLAGLQAYLTDARRVAGKIHVFLCHSRFLMNKMIEYGYSSAKFRYVPHFVEVEETTPPEAGEPFALYFGRLAREKGVHTLVRAAQLSGVPLTIVGSGSEEASLRALVAREGLTHVRFVGPLWGEPMKDLLRRARCVVCPSEWYENSPLTVYESMALGKPVVGADIGGIPELVQDGVTGLLFRAGDAADLAAKLRQLMDAPDAARRWGEEARRIAKREFAADAHYEQMMAVYADTRRLAAGSAA